MNHPYRSAPEMEVSPSRFLGAVLCKLVGHDLVPALPGSLTEKVREKKPSLKAFLTACDFTCDRCEVVVKDSMVSFNPTQYKLKELVALLGRGINERDKAIV